MHPAQLQANLAKALQMITEETDREQIRTAMAYAFGYIDAMVDAGQLLKGEADQLQDRAVLLRDKHLAALGHAPVPTN